MKIERRRIHFLSDMFSPPSPWSDFNVPPEVSFMALLCKLVMRLFTLVSIS